MVAPRLTTYRGRVQQVTAAGVFVLIPQLARTAVFGPCPTLQSNLVVGTAVLVAPLGGPKRSGDFVVLGAIVPPIVV